MSNPYVAPIDGPSPNVGSGLVPPYGIAPVTNEDNGVLNEGTGLSLGLGGIVSPTNFAAVITDQEITTNPSTRTAEGNNGMSPNVESGLPAGTYPQIRLRLSWVPRKVRLAVERLL